MRMLLVFFSLVLQSQGQDLAPECTYEHDVRTFFCKNIISTFPKKFYGNYHLKCNSCTIPIFSQETFPYENQLVSFNASESQIQIVTERAFSNLGNVQYIYLQANKIRNVSRNAFYGLRQVYELHLEKNSLKDLSAGFLGHLEANSVVLSENRIEELKDDVFEDVLSILALDLSSNRISRLGSRSFRHLDGLEYLMLNDNAICHIPLGLFESLTALTNLNLADNRLRSVGVATFSGLRDLVKLNLSGNAIVEFDASTLLPFSHIAHLDVSRNSLFYLDPYALRLNAPTLRVLTLEGNLWSCGVLKNVLQYFKSVSTKVVNNLYYYGVQNIIGIACTDAIITEQIDRKVYMQTVEKDTEKYLNVC